MLAFRRRVWGQILFYGVEESFSKNREELMTDDGMASTNTYLSR